MIIPKPTRNMVLAAAGAGALSYFVDTWGKTGDVVGGAVIGLALGHPILGAAAAFLTPSRKTIRGLLGRPDGALVTIPGTGGRPRGISAKVWTSMTEAERARARDALGKSQSPREAAAKPTGPQFARWGYEFDPAGPQSGAPMGWYDTTGTLQHHKPPQAQRDEAARHADKYARDAEAQIVLNPVWAEHLLTLAEAWGRYA